MNNSEHIDRIMSSLKDNPKIWEYSWQKLSPELFRVWEEAWFAANAMPRGPKACVQSWELIQGGPSVQSSARSTARSAILALMVYDNAADYLTMSASELKLWALITQDHAATLMYPAVYALEKVKELQKTS